MHILDPVRFRIKGLVYYASNGKSRIINRSMRLNYRHNFAILTVACLYRQRRSLERARGVMKSRKACFPQLVENWDVFPCRSGEYGEWQRVSIGIVLSLHSTVIGRLLTTYDIRFCCRTNGAWYRLLSSLIPQRQRRWLSVDVDGANQHATSNGTKESTFEDLLARARAVIKVISRERRII